MNKVQPKGISQIFFKHWQKVCCTIEYRQVEIHEKVLELFEN